MTTLSNEKEIEAAALAQVAAMFQRPSQLEKLDVLRKRADRKKAAVEAMLRSGVQSQLEGIRAAIAHLQTASTDVKEIENSMQTIFQQLQAIPELKVKMSKLSQANTTHSQYAAAMENLKHIFNIADTIEKTHEFIMDGKLLQAHKNIMELENARDDLMFEVHKLRSERREYDKNLLKNYFTDVEKLVQDLGKQIWYICSRALEAVCGNEAAPQQLVSALRIIEREERIDQHYIDQMPLSNNFVPPGRPRQWRKHLFEVLLKNVRHRVEGNQFEDRTSNRQWLARYLEVCRRTVVEDLKIVKSGMVACFPPEYNIYDRYIKMYHDTIALRVKEISSEPLEKNELVQLLSWIQAYPTEAMLGTPKLGIQAQALVQEQPLLPKSTTNQLYDRFVELTKRDMTEWLDKALMQEKDDWYKHVVPEVDSNGCYYTQLPSILFGMIEDTVALSKEIAQEIIPRAIDVGIDSFHSFAAKYKDAAIAYKGKHFEDRAFFQQYTSTVIAVANNLDICNSSTDKLEKHIRLTMETASPDASYTNTESDVLNATSATDTTISSARSTSSFAVVNRQELIQKIEQLKKKWTYGIQFAITGLLDEVLEDISKHLEQLMTRTWLMGSTDLETICITVADYYNDYKHLRSHIQYALLKEIVFKVVAEYIIGIDSRRISFANYEERHLAAERLRADADRVEQLFKGFFEHNDYSMPMITSVISAMAEVIDLRDKSLLTLEASAFVRKFPDIQVELLTSILQIREDVARTDARTIAEEAVNNAKFHPKGDQEILKLFSLCKSGGKRVLPALESTMQNMFANMSTLVMTTSKTASR
ncbi:exocyst complex component sec6 domain-containing protein [Ditylenchus destructor]|uniref:Exocyst complex component sec6 domain-containing protein n=1 Tax=Ditylenchus destructor TaxID=166010 RepID=A0AAD4RA38_9BILA|nr:exocyst complex component sec6 domain-containing protein [Ditylenchus destructor]